MPLRMGRVRFLLCDAALGFVRTDRYPSAATPPPRRPVLARAAPPPRPLLPRALREYPAVQVSDIIFLVLGVISCVSALLQLYRCSH